jgi:hypothetical protein
MEAVSAALILPQALPKRHLLCDPVAQTAVILTKSGAHQMMKPD